MSLTGLVMKAGGPHFEFIVHIFSDLIVILMFAVLQLEVHGTKTIVIDLG